MKFNYLYKININSFTRVSVSADPTELPRAFPSDDLLSAVKILQDT